MKRSARRAAKKKDKPLTDTVKQGSKGWGKVVEGLKAIPFMADMSGEELDEVAAKLTLHKFANGERIVAAGEAVDAFYQLHTGAAAMQMDGESVHDYAPGAFFGAPFPELPVCRRWLISAVMLRGESTAGQDAAHPQG